MEEGLAEDRAVAAALLAGRSAPLATEKENTVGRVWAKGSQGFHSFAIGKWEITNHEEPVTVQSFLHV